MTKKIAGFISGIIKSLWIAGPIFDKELRVSSRRRRNYILRFVYLSLLIIFLSLVWLAFVNAGSSGLYTASRMSQAGKCIIAYIIGFQFIVAQVVAVIMLSISISDEIQNRTLGTLMTTPINSFQVVMGKLFSKLLQLILLLAISLPLLAMVRVFGGVPWGYVISTLCITITTVIFVGSLSLFFSIFNKRSYVVIITTFVSIGVIFAMTPYMIGFGCKVVTGHWPSQKMTGFIFCANPYTTMLFKTLNMLEPNANVGIPSYFWPIHCAIILGASAVVLFFSVLFVRKVALRQATGQSIISGGKRSAKKIASMQRKGDSAQNARTRPVKGSPVIWKELRAPLIGKRKFLTYFTIFFAFILLIISYGLFAGEGMLDDRETHIVYSIIFMGLGVLLSIAMPAASISNEKESRSWPLLLSTTLTDWQIVSGKFLGGLRYCVVGWSILLGHVLLFTLLGIIHPIGLIHIIIVTISVSVFLAGTGLYFSSRFKHTTSAVIANLFLAAFIWLILPLLLNITAQIFRVGRDLAGKFTDTNPFIQTACIMNATADKGHLINYDWISVHTMGAIGATLWLISCMLTYVLIGVLFLWRTKCRIRDNIF